MKRISTRQLQTMLKGIPNIVLNYVKKNPGKTIAGFSVGAGVGILASDDIEVRKKLKETDTKTKEVIRKQDAEINVLKEKADKVDDVMALNEQLQEAFSEKQEGEKCDEEPQDEDRTAD